MDVFKEIVDVCVEIMPAGYYYDQDGLCRGHLGWTLLAHVSQLCRQRMLMYAKPWADNICTFPVEEAIQAFIARGAGCSLVIDFDKLLPSSRYRDISDVLSWLRYHGPDTAYRTAKQITCTIGRGIDVLAAANYSEDGILDVTNWEQEFWSFMKYDRLRVLTLPLSSNIIPEFSDLTQSAANLRVLHLVGVNVEFYAEQNIMRPRIQGYRTVRRWRDEATGSLQDLLKIVDGLKMLEELHIEDSEFVKGSQQLFTPVFSSSLRHVVVISSNPDKIELVHTYVRTLTPWTVSTWCGQHADIPGFIQPVYEHDLCAVIYEDNVDALAFIHSDKSHIDLNMALCLYHRRTASQVHTTFLRPNVHSCRDILMLDYEGPAQTFLSQTLTHIHHLVISVGNGNGTSIFRRRTWKGLEITSVGTLTMNVCDDNRKILTRLPCPAHIELCCGQEKPSAPGLDSLATMLKQWRTANSSPIIFLTGLPGSGADIVLQLQAHIPDINVTDQRTMINM